MSAAGLDDESLLTVQQVADWLNVEPRYVYRLASSGALLRVYVGRYVRVPIASVRAYIKANEDIVRRVVRSYAEGVQLFKSNKAAALKMIQNQLKVKEPEIQEDTYNQFRDYLEYPPYVSRKGMQAVLDDIAEKNPAAKNFKPDDFLDMRFVAELDKKAGGK